MSTKPKPTPEGGSQEFRIVPPVEGQSPDAALHDPILDNPIAEALADRAAAKALAAISESPK